MTTSQVTSTLLTRHKMAKVELSGVWAKLFRHLAGEADNEYAMIDSTIVRAHQHSAGAQKKRGKTKRLDAVKAG